VLGEPQTLLAELFVKGERVEQAGAWPGAPFLASFARSGIAPFSKTPTIEASWGHSIVADLPKRRALC
jgi:hypothetical protein